MKTDLFSTFMHQLELLKKSYSTSFPKSQNLGLVQKGFSKVLGHLWDLDDNFGYYKKSRIVNSNPKYFANVRKIHLVSRKQYLITIT